MDIIKTLCDELNIRKEQAENTIKLLDEGNTIAFIARYRKEVTGSLDDKTLRAFFDRLTYLRSFVERKEEINVFHLSIKGYFFANFVGNHMKNKMDLYSNDLYS